MNTVGTASLPIVDSTDRFNRLFGNLKDQEPKPNRNVARFFFIRHGESTANQEGINAGQTVDSDLTSKGREQVRQTALLLAETVGQFDEVYITPLKRTAQSIEEVRKIWQQQKNASLPEAKVEKAFIEKFCGSLEGANKKIYEPFKIKEEEDIKKLGSFEEKFSYKMVPDQESLKDVFERAQPAIKGISQKSQGKNILVVGHVGMMRSLILGTLAERKVDPVDLEVRSFDLPNASILVMESDGKTVELTAAFGLKFLR